MTVRVFARRTGQRRLFFSGRVVRDGPWVRGLRGPWVRGLGGLGARAALGVRLGGVVGPGAIPAGHGITLGCPHLTPFFLGGCAAGCGAGSP